MFRAREDILGFFEKGIFPFTGNVFKTKFINNGIALIERESKDINNDLFKKHFDFSTPIDLAKNYLK